MFFAVPTISKARRRLEAESKVAAAEMPVMMSLELGKWGDHPSIHRDLEKG